MHVDPDHFKRCMPEVCVCVCVGGGAVRGVLAVLQTLDVVRVRVRV